MRGTVTEAYVLRRSDYQETSRIVTLFTRELGRISCLARGAHREGSPFLGSVDLWLRVEARVGRRSSDMQLLLGLRVLHGNHGLLPEKRARAAVYLTQLWNAALPEGRADAELFDLFKGGLMLVEAVDQELLPLVRLALEVKFLAALGLLPEADRCGECEDGMEAGARLAPTSRGGLLCRKHGEGGIAIAPSWLKLMSALAAAKGREIPRMSAPASVVAGLARVTARLVERALERRPPQRKPRGHG